MNWSVIMARLRAGGWAAALLLLVVVAGMLPGVFVPGQTLFSNDGPLGQLMAQCHRLPDRFAGCWLDLNSVGFNGGAASPGLSFGLQWLLGPVWFSKLYAMLSLLILGLGAWCFFRQLKLSPLACLLGGLAVVLNSTFFSAACWGVGAHDLTAGMIFFALAALADTASPQRWLRVILAGLAVGMAVTEGADVGAIFSILAAAFILYQSWMAAGPRAKSLAAGAGRLGLVVVFAAFLAAQSIHGLVTTSIVGVKGAAQDAQTKSQRWDWATQWSLPKLEVLNLVSPGLFGYRQDTRDGGNYWGRMGRDPAWDKYEQNGGQGRQPNGPYRYSGGGNYDGELVVLVALWAAAQSLRRKYSVFEPAQRRWLWFWLAVAVVSLLLALGRFAPFYQLVYALPYFSTIRNPTKFLYLFSFALVVLFAYGVDALYRRHLHPAVGSAQRWSGLSTWWKRAATFDRLWVCGCALVWLASLLAWRVYAGHREELVGYLQGAKILGAPETVADFSIRQAGGFVLMFALAAGLLVLLLAGAFADRMAAFGGLCLTVLMAGDLCLANQPWIVYWNYQDKYASNPLFDLLRDHPYAHRVAGAPASTSPQLARLSKLYKLEWLQQQFPRYDIQSFENVEMSRSPEDYSAFMAVVNETNGIGPWFHLARAWQLTTTRYVLGPVDFANYFNHRDSLANDLLQPVAQFELLPRPGLEKATELDQLSPVIMPKGRFALFDFGGALPRAKLYSRWQADTNDAAVLKTLFDPAFDPVQSVFVAGNLSASPAADTNPSPGSVEIVSYAPKKILLQAGVAAPSVLLLNDHYDPNWKVSVDGRPAALLRCNFLMRGVQLAPGSHQVEFKFQPPTGWLWVSLAALATTMIALGSLIFWVAKNRAVAAVPQSPNPAPVSLAPLKAVKSVKQTPARKASGGRRA